MVNNHLVGGFNPIFHFHLLCCTVLVLGLVDARCRWVKLSCPHDSPVVRSRGHGTTAPDKE